MKYLPLFLLAALPSTGTALPVPGWLEPSTQVRIGFDSNPAGTGGSSAAILGDRDTLTFAAGGGIGLAWTGTATPKAAAKLTYNGEAVRFADWSTENYSTHRFGLGGQVAAGAWTFSGEGSSLLVAGSRDTLQSVATVNANGTTLWRERRRQWQHRLRLQAQASFGAYLARATGTLLAYDYQTRVVAGKVAFADRSDLQGAIDLGWKQSAGSLWIAGVRTGRQQQAMIPLPNCNFEYSNTYQRLAVGWEGKPAANTTLTFAAGPDFRQYSGGIDSRVFLGGRDRTSLWFEGGFATKLSPTLTLTGKATRMDWLSSTGKSAYLDTSVETAAAWTVAPAWTLRLTGKVHRCDYFPVYRDDWESVFGAGASLKVSKQAVLTLDALRQRAWSTLSMLPEREFSRFVITVGATIKL